MPQPEQLRVAVAGTSFAGAVQIPVFQAHARTRVVALSSGRAERARSVAAEHGVAAAYTDYVEMLDREKPDLVSIVTPPAQHCTMALEAIHRGIHVLCEKPFALNVEEADRMVAEAEAAGVVAMVDFEFRFLPARRFLLDLLRQNYVGRIRMVEIMFHFGWRSKESDVGWNWWSDRSQGGGALGALGSHAVDSLRLWMGRPRRVLCDLATFVGKREGAPVTSDDAYVMILEFESGARGIVHMSAVAGVEAAEIGIYGSEGQLVLPGYDGQRITGAKRNARPVRTLEIPERYQLARETGHFLRAPFRRLVDSLVEAVDLKQTSPAPSFQDGAASQQILDAARLSSDERRWVEF